ncbi:guanine nucleotide exchange protein for ADP-robosylation factor [Chytridiales sp. JEL 0842]|nr:guanine nucleotide exchange protein for ADP-robosylation factor [Chytridiales sp. JEL 0842]
MNPGHPQMGGSIAGNMLVPQSPVGSVGNMAAMPISFNNNGVPNSMGNMTPTATSFPMNPLSDPQQQQQQQQIMNGQPVGGGNPRAGGPTPTPPPSLVNNPNQNVVGMPMQVVNGPPTTMLMMQQHNNGASTPTPPPSIMGNPPPGNLQMNGQPLMINPTNTQMSPVLANHTMMIQNPNNGPPMQIQQQMHNLHQQQQNQLMLQQQRKQQMIIQQQQFPLQRLYAFFAVLRPAPGMDVGNIEYWKGVVNSHFATTDPESGCTYTLKHAVDSSDLTFNLKPHALPRFFQTLFTSGVNAFTISPGAFTQPTPSSNTHTALESRDSEWVHVHSKVRVLFKGCIKATFTPDAKISHLSFQTTVGWEVYIPRSSVLTFLSTPQSATSEKGPEALLNSWMEQSRNEEDAGLSGFLERGEEGLGSVPRLVWPWGLTEGVVRCLELSKVVMEGMQQGRVGGDLYHNSVVKSENNAGGLMNTSSAVQEENGDQADISIDDFLLSTADIVAAFEPSLQNNNEPPMMLQQQQQQHHQLQQHSQQQQQPQQQNTTPTPLPPSQTINTPNLNSNTSAPLSANPNLQLNTGMKKMSPHLSNPHPQPPLTHQTPDVAPAHGPSNSNKRPAEEEAQNNGKADSKSPKLKKPRASKKTAAAAAAEKKAAEQQQQQLQLQQQQHVQQQQQQQQQQPSHDGIFTTHSSNNMPQQQTMMYNQILPPGFGIQTQSPHHQQLLNGLNKANSAAQHLIFASLIAGQRGPLEQKSKISSAVACLRFSAWRVPMSQKPGDHSRSASGTPTGSTPSSSSDVFIRLALEQLLNCKESKKIPNFKESARKVLDSFENDQQTINTIFLPFQQACQSKQSQLTSIAIDCLGKLFSYNFWAKFNLGEIKKAGTESVNGDSSEQSVTDSAVGSSIQESRISGEEERVSMDSNSDSVVSATGSGGTAAIIGQVIDTICDTFTGSGEGTDDKVQVQIVKALLAAVSCSEPESTIHGSVLLRAIRTTYNIFLLSKSATTQIIAQATLTQMIQAIFSRIPKTLALPKNQQQFGSVENLEESLSAIAESQTDSQESADEQTDTSLEGPKTTAVDESNSSSFQPLAASEANASGLALSNLDKHKDLKASQDIFGENHGGSDHQTESLMDQYLKDGYLVFRALCKLSMKPIPNPEGATDLKSNAMRSKLLSLHLKELSVIFTEIIIPIVEARSSITFHQRCSLLKSLQKILSDPSADGGRLLVEIYLNYDCDLEASARENIWERLMNALSKVMTLHYATSDPPTTAANAAFNAPSPMSANLPPAITTATLTNFTKEQVKGLYSASGDFVELKKKGLELLVNGILKPLVEWCESKAPKSMVAISTVDAEKVEGGGASGSEKEKEGGLGLFKESDDSKKPMNMNMIREDDPTQFETLRHRKQTLIEGIKRFNFKAKKGMQFLLDSGLIPARTPTDIARFLLNTEGLNKSQIGEFLGEGNDENIAIMHAFVDQMNFRDMAFVPAIRMFLQHFRLPGEAQKIDRFMLKFAERYLQGNPDSFASADTAYVLAYSVIMLNTDQHNAQVKKRMTKADFLKNNRGINEGSDVPDEILGAIFDEIQSNEIVLKDEKPDNKSAGATDKTKKEVAQFTMASETMAMKSEEMFNNIIKSGKRSGNSGTATPTNMLGDDPGSSEATTTTVDKISPFFWASHFEHVKPMFQLIWMAILTAISGPLQESEDMDIVTIALEGFRYSARIACLFDMDLERKAFLSTLQKFTQLNNVAEMKPKSLEAIRMVLIIGAELGDRLYESWMDVVTCVSQLEKLQVASGADPGNQTRASLEKRRESTQLQRKDMKGGYAEEVAAIAASQHMTVVVDRLFTSSVKLSGKAIVEFVRCLCIVSWDEITSTASSEHPRMYCLQRLVEISYYNMKRIRVEWSAIWAILGEHFNQAGCHSNQRVAFFAIDKLRQLAMKFLELEELPNFKFQKDFLKPFDFVLGHHKDPKIKDMALSCLLQMIQAKSKSMKSGWKAILGACCKAARDETEQIVLMSFEVLKNVFKNDFESVVANLCFPDFITCLVEFCKNRKFPKTSLQSIEILRQTIGRLFDMSKTASGLKILQNTSAATEKTNNELIVNSGLTARNSSADPSANAGTPTGIPSASMEEAHFRFYFPILFGLYEVVMTCDLEVRTRGLTYLFDTLKIHGQGFSRDSWEVIAKGVLFPIFDDLRLSRQEHTKFANKEDMSVWLSTTLIQALRLLVDLFSVYLDSLLFSIDGLLDLLTVCMTQENETLARIGSTCLQQFIENNVDKMTEGLWDKICNMFGHLFRVTTPDGLFFDYREQMPEPPSGVVAPPESPDDSQNPLMEDGEASTPPVSDGARDVGGGASPEGSTNNVATGSNPNGSTSRAGSPRSPSSPSTRRAPISPVAPLVTDEWGVPLIAGRRRPLKSEYQGIIVRCVLHLLVIQTLQELLCPHLSNGGSIPIPGPYGRHPLFPKGTSLNSLSSDHRSALSLTDKIFKSMSQQHLFILVDCLERSFRFAKAFNSDMELRVALYKMGFMKQLPNLLKQETGSVGVVIGILMRMFGDEEAAKDSTDSPELVVPIGDHQVEKRLMPLCKDLLHHYNELTQEAKPRTLAAWKPVVVSILTALTNLDEPRFRAHVPKGFFVEASGLLMQPGELPSEIRTALFGFLIKAGQIFGAIEDEGFKMDFSAIGTEPGMDFYLQGNAIYGGIASDIHGKYNYTFLPSDAHGYDNINSMNVSQYLISSSKEHLGTLFFPSVAGGIAIAYNLPNVGSLILNSTVMGGIFSGTIQRWDHPALLELNPNVTLPNRNISVVARSGSSGASQIPYSVGYTPLDAVISSSIISYKLAAVVNAANKPVFPTAEAISEAMRGNFAFNTHAFVSIMDSTSPKAYPLALLNFLSTREHYNYKTPLPEAKSSLASNQVKISEEIYKLCANVTTTIRYMRHSFTDKSVQDATLAMGWIPLSGPLLDISLTALNSVTCYGRNVADLINDYDGMKSFYENDESRILWHQAQSFWTIVKDAWATTPISTGWSVAMTASLYLVSTITMAYNIRQYAVKYDARKTISSMTKAGKGPTPPKPKPFRGSLQNGLALLSSFITIVQFIALAMKNSKISYDNTLTEKLFSYIAIFHLKPAYAIVFYCVVFIWLLCLLYMIAIRPFAAEHFPEKIDRLETFHDFLAIFMPNFPFLFFTPALEALLEPYVCRLSTKGEWVSAFDPLSTFCWKGDQWALAVMSFFLANLFIMGVIRFAPIWKQLRQKFDLKDSPWFVVCEPWVKTFTIVSFFAFPAFGAMTILTVLSIGMALALVILKPNALVWFDYVRAFGYLISFCVCLALLVIEFIVKADDYKKLGTIREGLSDAVLAIVIVGFIATFFVAYLHLPRISPAELKKRREEILEIFNAISEGDAMRKFGSSTSMEPNLRIASGLQSRAESGSVDVGPPVPIVGSDSLRLGNSKISLGSDFLAQINWKQLENFIRKAAKMGMIEPKVATKVLEEIRVEGLVIAYTYAKSRGNMLKFLDLLNVKVWQLCGGSAKRKLKGIGRRGSNPPHLEEQSPDDVIVEEDELDV